MVSSAPTSLAPPTADDDVRDRTPVRRLEFVEVSPGPGRARGRTARTSGQATEGEAVAVTADATPVTPPEPTWSLWGDAEP